MVPQQVLLVLDPSLLPLNQATADRFFIKNLPTLYMLPLFGAPHFNPVRLLLVLS